MCTVKVVRRSATMNIAQASNVHHFFQVSCPGDKFQINFYPIDGRSRVAAGSVTGGDVSRDEDIAPNLVKETEVLCDAGEKLIRRMKAAVKNQTHPTLPNLPGYNFPVYQCRSYACDWFEEALPED